MPYNHRICIFTIKFRTLDPYPPQFRKNSTKYPVIFLGPSLNSFCFELHLCACICSGNEQLSMYMNLRRAREPCSSSSRRRRRRRGKSDKMPPSKFTPARNWGKLDFWNSESLMQLEAEAKIDFNLSTVFRGKFSPSLFFCIFRNPKTHQI